MRPIALHIRNGVLFPVCKKRVVDGWLRPAAAWLLLALAGLVLPGQPAFGRSELHFARVSFNPDAITGLAIVNPNPETATVTLTAYDSGGKPVDAPRNPVQIEIGASRQFASTAAEAFGTPAQVVDVAWVLAESEADDLAGFFLYLNSGVTIFDGGEIPEPASDLVFNQVRVEQGGSSEINLINTGEETAEVQLTLFGFDQPVVKTMQIAALGCTRFEVASYFQISSEPSGDRALYLRAGADQPLVGFGLAGEADVVGLSARPGSERLSRLIFPQLAVLGPFKSELVLVNHSTAAVIARVTAHKPDGSLYAPEQGANPVTLSLVPEAAVRRDLEELFGFSGPETLDGWLEVEASSESLNGVLTYSIPSIGSAASVAAVAQGETSGLFSHIATSLGFYTGVAALNPGTMAANLEVSAFRPDGSLVGSAAQVLRPGERVSRLIEQFVPDAAGMAGGFIRVTADLPLYLTSLFGSLESGVLANIPPQRVPADFRPDAEGEAIAVSPKVAVIQPGRAQQFISENPGPVDWSVNSVPGGDPEVGTIDPAGRYLAPTSSPALLPVTVSAASGTRSAGASVDIVSKSDLLSGLGLLQSVTYLKSLQRLYAAEVAGLSGASEGVGPASNNRTAILDLTQAVPAEVAVFEDETISGMVPFLASDGREYLVMAAESGGSVIRLDPSDGSYQVVLDGLSSPSSVVIDSQEERLLVAETEEVSSYPLSVLEAGPGENSAVSRQSSGIGRKVLLAARRGRLAIDQCTGNILVSLRDEGVILELSRSTGAVRAVATGLQGPGAPLGFYRRGVGCPAAFHLLVPELSAKRILLVVPADGTLRTWLDASAVTGLEFLPEGNPLTGKSGVVLTETDGSGSSLRFVPLPGIYMGEVVNPFERKALPPCTIQQLTSTLPGQLGQGAISPDGGSIAFSLAADPIGENPELNEELFLLRHDGGTLRQLTHTGTGRNWNPVLSPEGKLLMFRSNSPEFAQGGGAQSLLVLLDLASGITRVLPGLTPVAGNFDRTGLELVYSASGDPAGTNPTRNSEVYLYNLESRSLLQLTNSAAGANYAPRLSGDGTRFAFLSTANFEGSNPGGALYLYLVDRPAQTVTPVARVADAPVPPDDLVFVMDDSASLLLFNSRLDLVGDNPRLESVVYLYDVEAAELRQVTSPRRPSRASSIDALGRRVALTSSWDPLGLNRDGNQELFLFDTTEQVLEQISRTRRAANGDGRFSADGKRLLFSSNGNLTGGNSDQSQELFIGLCQP